jgi:hypothetical protein
MHKSIKTALLAPINLGIQNRIARLLMRNVAESQTDVAFLENMSSELDSIQLGIDDRIRKRSLSGRWVTRSSMKMRTYLMEDEAPWQYRPAGPIEIPGMISDEEARYYEYIAQLYEGRGEVVELGPWLGKSTHHIIRGLKRNPHFKKLHVFDDFIWRSSWMDRHSENISCPQNHASFRQLFDQRATDISEFLDVNQGKLSDHDGNESLPLIRWSGGPIEIMYIDCGRTYCANAGWFDIFSPSLLPGVSLLIMQDWRTHRERPRLSYNETLWFTKAHPELELVHEVQNGGLATFIYQHRDGSRNASSC